VGIFLAGIDISHSRDALIRQKPIIGWPIISV